jgi:hypothetical protein
MTPPGHALIVDQANGGSSLDKLGTAAHMNNRCWIYGL